MKMISALFVLTIVATPGFAQEKLSPAPVKSGVVELAPANTRIDFVGTHEGAKPDPRKGGFAKFTGKAQLSDSGTIESISIDIETASLWSEIPKLTAHLKSPDFFDVRQHSKATFRSTSIQPAEGSGKFDVSGNFTLLGKTNKIKIPVSVTVTSQGLTLLSKFTIDRTQFGMTYGQGKVTNDVTLTVAVGKPTTAGR